MANYICDKTAISSRVQEIFDVERAMIILFSNFVS